MPRKNNKPGTTRAALTDDHIERLTRSLCHSSSGNDKDEHVKAAAFLILLSEVERPDLGDDAAANARRWCTTNIIKRTAFSFISDEAIEAQIDLLRSESISA